jgi:hypothetical protein
MAGSGLRARLAERPLEQELPRIAALAAFLAAVPAALMTLAASGGLREYAPVLVLVLLVTVGVFGWGLPAALDLDESGPSAVALGLSGLGFLTLLLFWTGLPAVLAAGGIVLGRTQLDVPEGRVRAVAAMGLGLTALVLYLLFSLASLV